MKALRYLFAFALVIGGTVIYANAQNIDLTEIHQFVVMPRDLTVPLLVAQPDAPLEFTDTTLLVNVRTGHWIPSFRIRNRGTKPIAAFTVASAGADEWEWKADASTDDLMPGRVMSLGEDSSDEIIPLTERLRDKLKLRGPAKGIIALLVVRVQYADGSEFRETGYEALGKFFHTMRAVLNDPRLNQTPSH